MIGISRQTLLRRTAAALGAAAAMLLVGGPAYALSVTLSTGGGCTYSGMTVDPNGNLAVTCSGTTQPPPPPPPPGSNPGTFEVSVSGLTMSAGGTINGTIVRSNGMDGAVNVNWSATGAGCVNNGGTMAFADQSINAQPGSFQVVGSSTGGLCTVAISNPTGGTLGPTNTVNIQFGSPVTVPPGCSQPPVDMLTTNFQGLGQWWPQLNKSGQIVSIPLPAVQAGHYSGQAAFGENAGSAYTPQPVTLEITISKCPGFIDVDTANPSNTHPNGNYCNLKSPNGSYNQITWFGKPYLSLTSATTANGYGYCWAPESDGQWYLNARWSYGTCPFGQAKCGFAIQQNLGPY